MAKPDLSRFDKIDLDELRDFPSAREAQCHFLTAFETIANQPSLMWFHSAYRSIFRRVAQLSDCLRANFKSAGETFGVRSVPSEHVYFISGDNGGASCVLRYENDVLIVLDRNVILQAYLFSYFMTLPDPYARIIAAVLLVLGGHRAHGPIPFQEQLSNFAATRNQKLSYQTLNDVVDFIALHELGHLAEQPPESLLHVIIRDSKSAIEIDRLIGEDIRQFGNPGNERFPRHRCFGTYRLFETCHQGFSTLRRSIDDPWSLYIDHEKSRKLGEFASDMFAVYARSILDSSGGFHSLVLDQLPFRVLILNHLFFYLATINHHREGISAQVNLRRFKETKGFTDYATYTHPSALTRLTSIVFHCELLDHRFHRDPDREEWRLVRERIRGLWRYDFLILIDMILDALKANGEKPFGKEVQAYGHMSQQYGDLYTDWTDLCKAIVVRGYGELIGLMNLYWIDPSSRSKFDDFVLDIGKRIFRLLDQKDLLGPQLARLVSGLLGNPERR